MMSGVGKRVEEFIGEKRKSIENAIQQYTEGLISGPEMLWHVAAKASEDGEMIAAIHEYQTQRADQANALVALFDERRSDEAVAEEVKENLTRPSA